MARVLIIGASGLIGYRLALGLRALGLRVTAAARRFERSQASVLGADAVCRPLVGGGPEGLGPLFDGGPFDAIVNCVGALQDAPGQAVDAVHTGFVSDLVAAIGRHSPSATLVHLSVPGVAATDQTAFSRSKRVAEQSLRTSGLSYVILRPGFVIAADAYGGSALMRALAVLPLELPQALEARPFAPVAVADIVATVGHIAARAADGQRFAATWDLMVAERVTVGDVRDAFAARLGAPARRRLPLPAWALGLGACAGDLVSRLGWRPPVRTTALAELVRGVEGDPRPWIAATGLVPTPLADATGVLDTVQERWFARLYLLKALVFSCLAAFWVVSGTVALFAARDEAAAILAGHGFSAGSAQAVTWATGLLDMAIGALIAVRRTARTGLAAGIIVSLAYLAAATVLAPELWSDPLGALVKTGPTIVLALVALAIAPSR